MSCDEAVIRKMGEDIRADYSASLLTLATGRRIIAGTPLAFGEGDTKGRIKNLGKWKKPAIWIIVIAVIVCIILAVCLLTNPVTGDGDGSGVTYYEGTVVVQAVDTVGEDNQVRHYITIQDAQGNNHTFWMPEDYLQTEDLLGEYVIIRTRSESNTGLTVATNISIKDQTMSETLDDAINQATLDHNWSERYEGMFTCASFVQLSSGSNGVATPDSPGKLVESATVYGIALHQVFRLENGILVEEGGSNVPVVLTFTYDVSKGFTLTEYWEPRDGSYYAKDLKSKFNGRPWPDTQKYIQQQMMDNYVQAMEYYQVGTDVLINTLLDSVRTKTQFTLLENLIEGKDTDVQILLHYSNETLQYCFSEFLDGNQTDTRADIMAAICKKIASDWGEPVLMIDSDPPMTAQEWFDFYYEQAIKLLDKYSSDEILKKYPASWILLSMEGFTNESAPDGYYIQEMNRTYKYKYELTGTVPATGEETTIIFYADTANISFEDVASVLDGFDEGEKALDIYVEERGSFVSGSN